MKNTPSSLYIHIPFCRHLCDYCDFTKMFYLPLYVRPYIKLLIKQISAYKNRKFKTIYIGGGTPNSLTPALLKNLLGSLKPLLRKNGEFTMEVNIESLSKAKLKIMKESGINRISLGVQSFNEDILKSINRQHRPIQIKYWIKQMRKMGFTNLSIDLIYGLPKQTLDVFSSDISRAISLGVDHISSYALTIHPNTVFYLRGIKELSSDESRQFYDLLYHKLQKNGYYRYEVSNFAHKRRYSKHNLNYWQDGEYIALGLGAHGYEHGIRYQNTKNIHEYLKGNFIADQEILSINEQIEEYILLNLRLSKGINKKDFKKRFKFDLIDKFLPSINLLKIQRLLIETKSSFKTTYEGMMLLDSVVLTLFECL